MASVYYVDDGGSATAPYDTWAKAATSLSALDDAVAFASGDIVYIGHDHVCQFTHAANRTITGPTSGLPTIIISATQGSSPPTYQKSSTDQVDTSEGAYSLTFDGPFALYGLRIKSGANIAFANDGNEASFVVSGCVLAPAANGYIGNLSNANTLDVFNCTIDLTADGTTPRSSHVFDASFGRVLINGLTFINAAYRTGAVFGGTNTRWGRVSGVDMSGFTNATLCNTTKYQRKAL